MHDRTEHDKRGYQRDGDCPATSKIDELLASRADGVVPRPLCALSMRERPKCVRHLTDTSLLTTKCSNCGVVAPSDSWFGTDLVHSRDQT